MSTPVHRTFNTTHQSSCVFSSDGEHKIDTALLPDFTSFCFLHPTCSDIILASLCFSYPSSYLQIFGGLLPEMYVPSTNLNLLPSTVTRLYPFLIPSWVILSCLTLCYSIPPYLALSCPTSPCLIVPHLNPPLLTFICLPLAFPDRNLNLYPFTLPKCSNGKVTTFSPSISIFLPTSHLPLYLNLIYRIKLKGCVGGGRSSVILIRFYSIVEK